jgi:prepilin-type N-terminal cleavage/methylation domain-containing protein
MIGRQRRRNRSGFTLIEILVAVAILAVLSAALTPMVIKYVNDGRRARALSDSQAIGQAILAFNLDTGRWPVNDDTNPNDAGELSRLVGLPAAQISAANVPDGAGATGAGNWNGGGSGGNAGALEDSLILNRNAVANPLYPVSPTAPESPGWNGPYLKQIPLDPWGRPYVCNVRYLDGAAVTGATAAEEDAHAVFCLSAGPDGVFNTSFDDATTLAAPGGDDVGWPIQGQHS